MSQIDDNIMEKAEMSELRAEIMGMLDNTDAGLSSEDLFQKSQIAGEKKEVSQTLGGLRTGGYISATDTDKGKVYVLTSKGRSNLLHGEENVPTQKRKTIELPAPVAAPGNKAPEKAVIEPKVYVERKKEEKGRLAMVPNVPAHRFRCMLTSESSLIIEIPNENAEKSQKVELTEDQVHVLWEYMARIYPKMVRIETK